MGDFYERIKFAIDIRRIIAEAATPGPWEWTIVRGKAYIGRPDTLPSVAEVEWEADVHHILANAPDAVIRQCDRDLRVLERHASTSSGCCLRCCDSSMHAATGHSTALWPCDDIRDLAAAYDVDVPDVRVSQPGGIWPKAANGDHGGKYWRRSDRRQDRHTGAVDRGCGTRPV